MTEKVTEVNDQTMTPTPHAANGPIAPPIAAALPPPLAPEGVPPKEKGPSFAELGLRPEVLRAIEEMGFTEPMMVQTKTLPLIMEGRDLMVQSRTGSGKTAAFGIPFANGIARSDEKYVQALVLLPTRELALQVAAELARIAAHSGLVVVPVYGGAPMGRQVEMLSAGGQIVCGTPGRVLDHLRRGTLKLDRVKCAVLDECDEMLSMGFQEDIEAILERTPETRQTLLFSATVPEGIQRLSRRFLRNPEFLKLSADFIGVHEIKHLYYAIPGVNRESELLRILTFEDPKSAIIFCNTREETGRIAEFLRTKGHDAEAISSDLSQSDRERVMARMRAGGIKFLVATDVAARGIDIENLSYVFNYTFPEAPEIYIHRTGRTGRAGKQGTAVSLIGPTEVGSFYYLKLLYKIRPEERALPSEVEIRSRREGERVLALRAALAADPGAEWKGLARRIMSAIDGERMVAALLARSFAQEEGMPAAPRPVPVAIASAAPAREAVAAPRDPDRERASFGAAGARGGARTRSGFDRAPRGERSERSDRGERPERGDRPERAPSTERPPERFERPERATGTEHPPERLDRPERAAGTERPERLDRPERGERSERSDRSGRSERRPERAARTETAPPPRASSAPGPEREFWEVWSEERSSTATSPEAAGSEAPAVEPVAAVAAGREPPAAFGAPEGTAPFARLYLNLGRKDGASDQQVLDLIATHAGPLAIEHMDIMNTHTYLNVAPDDADRICAALTGKEVAGREVICERAKPRRR
jgi:ATP-dependent RNA helicase DeaD